MIVKLKAISSTLISECTFICVSSALKDGDNVLMLMNPFGLNISSNQMKSINQCHLGFFGCHNGLCMVWMALLALYCLYQNFFFQLQISKSLFIEQSCLILSIY